MSYFGTLLNYNIEMPDLKQSFSFNTSPIPLFKGSFWGLNSLFFPDKSYTFNSTLPLFKPELTFCTGTSYVSSKKSSIAKPKYTGYASLSKSLAESKARMDSNLEKLSGGKGWSISSASFINDIPYAKRGMGTFLTKLSSEIGENIVVTSALGTSTSPHAKNGGHYDSNNPKLDFGGGLSVSAAESLKSKLDNTGYFARVEIESHGDGTAHLDVRVKESALKSVDTTA